MFKLFVPAAVLVATGLATAQTTVPTGTNQKIIFNENVGSIANILSITRYDLNPNTLYYMQPKEGHRGYTTLKGWEVALSDIDYQTSEPITFGARRYQTNTLLPDMSNTGLIAAASGTLTFPAPTTGTQSNQIWTVWVNTPYTNVPEELGFYVSVGAAKASGTTVTDGLFIYTQQGNTSKLATGLQQDWAYYITSTVTTPTAYFQKATTMWIGGLWTDPANRALISSTAYSASPMDLTGLEAIWPDSARKDQIGWNLVGDAYPNGVGVIFIGAALLQNPVDTTVGRLWMLPPLGVIQLPVVLDQNGEFISTSYVPAISNVSFYSQSAFVDPTMKAPIRVSDIYEVNMQ
ncbi:MAG: hypothetical protein R3F30_13075 [Planctomycetota bacterium]